MPSAIDQQAPALPKAGTSQWASAIVERVNSDTRARPWKNAVTQHGSTTQPDDTIINLASPTDNGAVA
jgi:hypothetical protein